MFRLLSHQVRGLTLLEVLADSAICFLALLLATEQLAVIAVGSPGLSSGLSGKEGAALQFALVMSLMFAFFGMYRQGAISAGLGELLRRAGMAVTIGAGIALLALSLRTAGPLDLGVIALAAIYIMAGVFVVRMVALFARRSEVGAKRVLIVGTDAEACDVATDIRERSGAQAVVVGFYPLGDQAVTVPGRVLSGIPIEDIVQRHRVTEIVVAMREQRGSGIPMDQLLACRLRGVNVVSLSGFYERTHGQVPIESLKASFLVYGSGFQQGALHAMAKRLIDLVGAILLLIVALPVMAVAALAIRLESPGSIIYRQERVGLGGRRFLCLKFRSMRSDAEKDGVARWATQNDSRVTRVGRFIRRTRIDELPQLLSVLGGEMSLVGPRPERPSFVDQLRETIPYYDLRHSVKPGLTGWAQVRYGYCATVDDARRKHQFDLYYVKNNSFFLDLLVLVETVSVVLFREGSQ